MSENITEVSSTPYWKILGCVKDAFCPFDTGNHLMYLSKAIANIFYTFCGNRLSITKDPILSLSRMEA